MKNMKKIILFILIFLSVNVFTEKITFILDSPEASTVFLRTDINKFKPIKLEKSISGLWKTTLEATPGDYLYIYYIDGIRTKDYKNNEFDYYNDEFYNIRKIEKTYYPIIGDNKIKYLKHENERFYINPVNENLVYLRVKVSKNDIKDLNIQSNADILSKKIYEIDNEIVYEFKLKIKSNELKYRFLIYDGGEIIYGYNKSDEFYTLNMNRPKISYFDTPSWAKGEIIYQIFPDRFRNFINTNDDFDAPNWYGEYNKDELMFKSFGGDLKGIENSLDYLSDLGIKGIYLNPIFSANSTHKYNTKDYFKIDPSFGTEKDFEDLLEKSHNKDLKIIIDGVFNHTGIDFFAMKENFEKQENSKYLDWYYIKNFPIKENPNSYESWQNYASLPKLNIDNKEVKSYISRVLAYWTSMGIDGWRLDAVDQIPNYFWNDYFYHYVKQLNSDLLITGEYWKNSKNYFEYPSFDSVMNYLFKDAVVNYSKGGSANELVNDLQYYLNRYPQQVLNTLWNLLGSHDTRRIFTELDEDIEKLKIAVGIQMTFIGSPVIYYGDEIGMTGENDPFCRKPFIWDEKTWNKQINDYYKKLIKFRNQNDALKYGDIKFLEAKIGTVVYERSFKDEKVIVLINNKKISPKINLKLDGVYTDLISEKKYEHVEKVNSNTIMILYK
jgi:glycosidase